MVGLCDRHQGLVWGQVTDPIGPGPTLIPQSGVIALLRGENRPVARRAAPVARFFRSETLQSGAARAVRTGQPIGHPAKILADLATPPQTSPEARIP